MDEKSRKGTLFTWGNFFAGVAVVLLGVAAFYTKAYASYKDRAENQAAVIKELQSQVGSFRSDKDSLLKEVDTLRIGKQEAEKSRDYHRALAEERERQNKGASQQAQQDTQGLLTEIAALKAQKEALNTQIRGGVEQASAFKKLFEDERDRFDELNRKFISLNEENARLKAQAEQAKKKKL